jgi:hypothetical protein
LKSADLKHFLKGKHLNSDNEDFKLEAMINWSNKQKKKLGDTMLTMILWKDLSSPYLEYLTENPP